MKEVMKWKNITPKRIEKLLTYHKDLFGDEMSNYYKNCKCPGALISMLSDIKKYIIVNEQFKIQR